MKTKHLLFSINLFFILISLANSVSAQNSLIYHDPNSEFKNGVELFNKQKYVAAQKHFNNISLRNGENYSNIKTDAEYYSALCAIELFNSDAEYLITKFIEEHPESPRVKTAYFQMGKFQYRKKDYKQALVWFKKVNKFDLNNDELAEYYFKRGYSFFALKDYTDASKMFYELLDSDSKYFSPALFYYSHIAYLNKNYETALNGFTKLKDDVTFAPIVPYYISQIYFNQKKYDKIIQYVPSLLDSATTKRAPEIARIIGEAYYQKEEYDKALKYLEIYKNKSKSYTRDDIYQLAYVYYKNDDFKKASKEFQNVTNVDDLLSQNAYYYLADCFLKNGNKNKARMAFYSASKLDFDKNIKEDALYNYAKLTYELAYSPFNEIIKTFNQYLKQYPNSDKKDQVYDYLGKAYMTSKNYKDALTSIEKIKIKNTEILEAYQRIAYYRALELFSNLQFKQSIEAFDKALSVPPYNKTIKALSIYWKAEAYYRIKNYDNAIKNYKEFLLTPGSFEHNEYNNSYYNLGYSYFKKKNYPEAISWFRKYVDNVKINNPQKLSDAFIRIGDCYFVSRNYNRAVDFYAKAVKINSIDADYALFQQGFTYGLLKKYHKKISSIKKLLTDTSSAYYDDAVFELAKTYVITDSINLAINNYKMIINKFPNSSYVGKSLVHLGLLYYNKDENQKSIKYYKQAVANYPGTQEAKDALIGLKNIYVDLNDVNTYFDYVNSLGGFANVSVSEQDSLTYLAAEKIYMSGDCNKSRPLFKNYLKKYPNGNFVLNAYFYEANCDYKNNNFDDALKEYSVIISKPKNIFTEQSLLNSANINLNNKKDYTNALEDYTILENVAEIKSNLLKARIGQMHSAFLLKSYKNAIVAANSVLITEKVDPEKTREAHMILAKSYFAQNKFDDAIAQYRIISRYNKTKQGAEAKYQIAHILYIQKKYELAKQEIFNFINLNTSYQFWLAKSFILLSDIYFDNNDYFQAKANLKGIVDNYKSVDDGIIDTAKEKLEKIKKIEDAQFKQVSKKDIEINFKDNTNGQYDKLFEDENKVKNDTIK